jgi:uncharacterized protein
MRCTAFTCLLFIVMLGVSCGQKDKKTTTKEPADDSAQVVKKAGEYPEPTGYVSDFENLFSAKEEAILDSIIRKHEQEATNQVVIAVLKVDTTKVSTDEEFNQYTLALANHWGIGVKGKDNGVGIFICPELRAIRIQVGNGLEAKLTNQECANIIDEKIIPSFKTADFFNGTLNALHAVITEIK